MFIRKVGYTGGGSSAKMPGKDMFLQYCRKRHGFIYKYIYKECTQEKMVFMCPYHGKQSVDSHRHFGGLGCTYCLAEGPKSYSDFLALSEKRFGKEYKYPSKKPLIYNLQTRITIKCKHHGEFIKAAHAHLNGEGCPYCARGMLSDKQFIKAAKKIHKDKYDYSLVPKGILKEKVTIVCNSHGKFKQYAQSHLEESGCMDCVYTDRNPGAKYFYLYLFECRKGKMRFYKPGLANDVNRRGKEHARALAKGWSIKLLKAWAIKEHHGAFSTELYVLNNLPGKTVSKKVMKIGHTETKLNKLSQSDMVDRMGMLIRAYVRKSKKFVHKSQKFK